MKARTTSPVVSINDVPPADTSAYRPVVLVVDDESAIADTLTEILSRSGYAAMTAYDGNEALETALVTPPEMLITDVILPGMSGIELGDQDAAHLSRLQNSAVLRTGRYGRSVGDCQGRWSSFQSAP